MSKKWFEFKPVSATSAEIMIYDDIGMWGLTAKEFKVGLDGLGNVSELTVRINSYGGEVFDGFAIYNALKAHSASKTIVIDGVAASIASYIAMAGDKIQMPKNAFLMIHNPWGMTVGNAEEHEHTAEMLRMLEEKSVDVYTEKSSGVLSREDIAELMDKETWISADDAILYGLADEIIDNLDEVKATKQEALGKPKAEMSRPVAAYKMLFNKSTGPVKVEPVNKNKGVTQMNCRKCAKELTEGVAFCGHCGHDQSIDPVQQAREQERQELIQAERNRVNEIVTRCTAFSLGTDFSTELIKSGEPVEKCISKIMDKVLEKDKHEPVSPGSVFVNKDDSDKFREHAVNCLAVAGGVEKDAKVIAETRKDQRVSSLHSLMQRDLQRHGIDPIGMNPNQLTDNIFKMAAIGSSDLPAILLDTANKSLGAGYAEAPVTFQQWIATMEVNDFRAYTMTKMSNFSDIDDLPEGMPMKEGRFSDKKESVQVSTKGKKFTVTRNALINDDLNAMVRVPNAMGAAIARRQNKDVYDELTKNSLAGPALTEYENLFTAALGNLITSSGVPTISLIDAAERKLLEMPLPAPDLTSATQYSGVPARYLITGTTNRLAIMQLLGAAYDISKNIVGVPNPYQQLIAIFDPYLQAKLTAGSKANGWYLAADPSQIRGMVMAFLSGNRTPTFRQANSGIGEALGISMDIYADWGIGVEDPRAMVFSDGDA